MAGKEEETGGLLPKPCNADLCRNERSIEMPLNRAVTGNQTEKQGKGILKGLVPAPVVMDHDGS